MQELKVAMGAKTLINCQRWQEFKEDCGISFPGNFWGDYAHIFVPDRKTGNILQATQRSAIAQSAHRFRRKMVNIFWSWSAGCQPIQIRPERTKCQLGDFSTMSTLQALPTGLFSSFELLSLSKPLLDAFGRILESDRPMAIVRLRDQKQIFLNQKFSDMLATPPEIATGRSMKLGWNPTHLEECGRLIKQQSRFEYVYDSALNPRTYGRQTATIELVDDGVEQYRLNTNQGLELLEFPEHMKQLQRFDW